MHELSGVSWEVLVRLALSSVSARDKQILGDVNKELHRRFLEAVLGGKSGAQDEFVKHLSAILEDKEVSKQAPRGLDATVGEWRHLGTLVEMLRQGAEPVEEGRRLVESRAHARRLAEILKEEGKWVGAGDLARRLKVAAPNVARLNRALEAAGVVERKRVGRSMYVRLGRVGQLLMGK